MAYSNHVTLLDFMEKQRDSQPLFQFFKYLIENEEQYTAGAFPTEVELSFTHQGTNIAHLLLDAIAFGIHWEQANPSSYRERPIEHHFESPNALDSMEAIIDAQPHDEIANFFRYMQSHVDHREDDLTPPPALYNGANITALLRHAMFFGIQWEIWNADDLSSRLQPLEL